jgi:hypothetical protein
MRRALTLLLVCSPALASFERPLIGEIAVRDVPGTRGTWQEARVLVEAPPDQVLAWLTEFEHWPRRFRDVSGVRVVSRSGDTASVWMRSRIVGTSLVVDIHVTPSAIFYRGEDHNITTSGRIFLTAAGPGRTDVISQTTVHGGGLKGAFAPREFIRSRERAKLVSDLGDLVRLSRVYHAEAP